jgi:hypothetical protein
MFVDDDSQQLRQQKVRTGYTEGQDNGESNRPDIGCEKPLEKKQQFGDSHTGRMGFL